METQILPTHSKVALQTPANRQPTMGTTNSLQPHVHSGNFSICHTYHISQNGTSAIQSARASFQTVKLLNKSEDLFIP